MSDLIDDDESDGAGGNAHEFTVAELSGAIKRTVEGAYGHVRVRGEIGRVSRPSSGHIYLDLKDDRAVLASVIWKGAAQRLAQKPEEGMEVVATGRLTTFPGQSRYQLVIEQLVPAGVGALMAMLEKRKAALAAEGLFAAERKRPIPFLPGVVGVVTSPSGAVIRDILHRLRDRFPRHVLVWPVAVQGEASPGQVAAAIAGFNALPAAGPIPRPDVLIVARGGGSVEDLWGFNDERVVRAVAASAIPLISAVGHETDTTLIDLASDLRAPTPTAAAEAAVPVRAELRASLAGLEERRLRALSRGMTERRSRLTDLSRLLPRADQLLAERRQRLDAAGERLPRALGGAVHAKRASLLRLGAGLSAPALRARIRGRGERLDAFARRLAPELRRAALKRRDALDQRAVRLDRAGPEALRRAKIRAEEAGRLLASLNPGRVLERGFAIIRREGAVVTAAAAVSAGDALSVEFHDGAVSAVAAGSGEPAPKRPRGKGKRAGSGGAQGDLF